MTLESKLNKRNARVAVIGVLPDLPQARVYGPEPAAFLGGGHVQGGELIPTRLLSPPEVAALLTARGAPTSDSTRRFA